MSLSWWREFRQFISRGSVIDLAVGMVIGSAFTNIVNTLVKGVIMPPIGWILKGIDFNDLYINLSGRSYPSLSAAQAAGAPVIAYGQFLNAVIDFLIVAAVMFLIIKPVNRLRARHKEPDVPKTKACPYCCSEIPVAATRCPQCTSVLDSAVADG